MAKPSAKPQLFIQQSDDERAIEALESVETAAEHAKAASPELELSKAQRLQPLNNPVAAKLIYAETDKYSITPTSL